MESGIVLTADLAPFNVVTVLGLAGAPPVEELERTVHELGNRHPLLTAQIVGSDGRYELSADRHPSLALRVETGRAWEQVVEEGLNTSFDREAGPLASFHYLPAASGAGSHLVVSCYHAIIDGVSLLSLLRELLEAWSGRSRPPAAAAEPPSSAEAHFPPSFRGSRMWLRAGGYLLRQLPEEIRARRQRRCAPQASVPPHARNQILARDLAPELSAALARASRGRQISVASGLAAAVALAVHRLRYGGAPMTVRHVFMQDLRSRVQPPLDGRMGAFFTPGLASLRLPVRPDFWSVANDIDRRVRASRVSREPFLMAWLAPLLIGASLGPPRRRLSHSASSHMGRTDLPSELGARDLRAFVSNGPLGPELSVLTRLWRGQILLDLVTLDSEVTREQAGALADEIHRTLVAAASA